MVIGLDGNEANIKSRVGVNQYAFQLLWGLYNLQKEEKKGIKYTIFLKKEPLADLPPGNDGWEYKILPGKGAWILTKLTPYLLLNKKIDTFFTPSHYLPPFLRVPAVCTIHDLGYLKFSGQFKTYDYWQLKLWSAISIFISKYIISVSDFTAEDIVRHYKFAAGKVRVIYHGVDKQVFNNNLSVIDVRRTKKKYNIEGDYLLYLGTLKPSKNIESIVDAFNKIDHNKYRIKLVIAGKKGWFYEDIFKKVENLGLSGQVIFTDFIPDSDKPYLITGSKLFLSPSYWEGFGMHILEAMSCGIPVIASRVASIPEVGKDAISYVDPGNIEQLALNIVKYLEMDREDLKAVRKRLLVQAAKFDWKETALKTQELLKIAYEAK